MATMQETQQETLQARHPLRWLRGPWKLLAGLAIIAIAALAANVGDATAGGPSGGPQVFSIDVKHIDQLDGPADRMDISFGKPDKDLKVEDVFAITADVLLFKEFCFG